MNYSTRNKKLDLFLEICRKNNLKITPQRIAIYQVVVKSEDHPSADAIFRIVNQEFPSISFDTVNRTLITFTQIGLLTVAESYRGARRYDPNIEEHHHMHCMKCGRIIDFTSDDFNQLAAPEQVMKKFASVLSSRVVFNGICLDCHNKD